MEAQSERKQKKERIQKNVPPTLTVTRFGIARTRRVKRGRRRGFIAHLKDEGARINSRNKRLAESKGRRRRRGLQSGCKANTMHYRAHMQNRATFALRDTARSCAVKHDATPREEILFRRATKPRLINVPSTSYLITPSKMLRKYENGRSINVRPR